MDTENLKEGVEETKVEKTKVEETAEEKVEETKVEETAEEKAEETKVEETAEEKVEETKVEEIAEEKAEETKVEEIAEEKVEEAKAEEPKAEETKVDDLEPIKIELPPEEKLGSKIYSWLHEGEKYCFPFVVVGGLLVFLAYLIDTLAGHTEDAGAYLGYILPVSSIFKYVGNVALAFMIPVLSGYIAKAIAGKEALAAGLVGGMLANSGNQALASMTFTGKELFNEEPLDAFNKFLAGYVFAQPKGGQTAPGVLGGIIAGFVAGFLILGLKKACENMPESAESIKKIVIYPIVGILLICIVMMFAVNPLTGLVNKGMFDVLVSLHDAGMLSVLGLLLGAMVAFDMGGAFKKAAFIFAGSMIDVAQSSINAGVKVDDTKVQICYMVMASVMVGCMVPSFGIALSTWIFPKKFTKEERSASIPNAIMGAAAITEGSVPYVVADPLRVIPCSVLGAAVAGCLSMLFKCEVKVPYGGILSLLAVENQVLFLVAWLIGSALTCVTLGFWKKKLEVEENVN